MKTRIPGWHLVLAVSAAATTASAVTTSWLGSGDGFWHDAGLWTAGVPGISAADVLIESGGATRVVVGPQAPDAALAVERVTLNGSATSGPVLLIDGLGVRTFSMADSLNITGGGRFEIGDARVVFDGTLSGGGLHINDGSLRLSGGSLEVVGAVTRLGRVGVGVATQTAGTFASGGDVLVGDLPGSSGQWELRGGQTRVQGILYIADDLGSTGHVRVDGGDLSVTGPTLRVGDDGAGSLELISGLVQADHVSVGRGPGSVGDLVVDGGVLHAGDFSVGRFAGARGVVTVRGGLVEVAADTLYVGREGAGELRVQGGEVRLAELQVGATAGASGVVELSGGKLAVGRLVADQGGATLRVRGGELELGSSVIRQAGPLVIGDGIAPAVLRLTGGTNVFESGVVIESGARIEGSGIILGAITLRGVDARDGAAVGPGGGDTPQRPALTLSGGGAAWVVHVPSVTGWTYFLEDAVEGAWGSWRTLGSGVSGTGAVLAIPVPGPHPAHRLLRVRLERR